MDGFNEYTVGTVPVTAWGRSVILPSDDGHTLHRGKLNRIHRTYDNEYWVDIEGQVGMACKYADAVIWVQQ